jgi:hypothetical protein
VVARQVAGDGRRRRSTDAVRLDVDPCLEQPLEPEHVRRGPVAVQAADVCSYLRSVRGFWSKHGWLGSYPYLWGMDEAGASRFKVVRQQAKVTHACFRGGHVIVTGKPTAQNRFLWNGGRDDVDDWVVLSSRYYGQYTNPAQSRRGISHATQELRLINSARRRHKQIWTYTYYAASHSTPGFTGLLYGQGTTTYSKGNPLVSNDKAGGSFVLLYPGRDGPIACARLEVLREGIEDWEILNVVRHKHGKAAVRRLLSTLFSTTSKGVKLGCTIGCALKTKTPYSWPVWSHDATTPRKVAQMRVAALRAATEGVSSNSRRRAACAGAVGSSSCRK